MKPTPVLAIATATLAFLLSDARAGELIISADSVSATRSALRENGLDWALLPKDQGPESAQIVRGTFSQSQAAATRRALSGDGITKRESFSRPAPAGKQVEIPSADGREKRVFLISAAPQAGGKILVKVEGSDPASTKEAEVATGEVIVISLPGKEPDSADIYFVKIKNE